MRNSSFNDISERIHRWWQSWPEHSGLRYWLLTRGILLLGGYLILFVATGYAIGYRRAYDVSIGITSPATTSQPALAWILSIVGWLVAPAAAGGVAGYMIANTILSRRVTRLGKAFDDEDGR
jgi:hypothetical protein